MIKLFPRIIKMKPATTKVAGDSTSEKATHQSRPKNSKNVKIKEKVDATESKVERCTRSIKLKQESVVKYEKSLETKTDLSKFKIKEEVDATESKVERCTRTNKLDKESVVKCKESLETKVDLSKFKIKEEVNATKSKVERCTRINKVDDESVVKDEENLETKVDLSKFKLKSKVTLKQPGKRQHVTIEYDKGNIPSLNKAKSDTCSSENEQKKKVGKTKLPPNWEEVLKNLREMRKDFNAPVDTMGCDSCADVNASPEDQRFQSLLSLMLSSQTKDQVTHAAMLRLREHGCSLDNILQTSDKRLGELIYPVGFWKTKVKYIKRAAAMIKEEFHNDIPKTVTDLCKLPGVGPKMAHLCMKTAWGQITGIGVDIHVHRISNRLGWVKTKTPENTRKALEGWLPFELWSEVNHLLVGFGQQKCKTSNPQCSTCLNNQLCPFGRKETSGATRKPK